MEKRRSLSEGFTMSYQVTRVEFFGQPNRRVWIKPELDSEIDQRIKQLPPAADRAAERAISCWPNTSDRELFMYLLPDGRLMYVLDARVELPDGARVDGPRDLEKWAREAMVSGTVVAATDCRVCGVGDPAGPVFRCRCDSPIDLSIWNVARVINHNNCYSFARRTRWCAGSQGSQPGNQSSSNEEQIRAGLERDHLVRVGEAEVLNGNGEFVALFLEGAANYHFLRLDGDRWTHMPNGHPAIACDADSRPILKARAPKANLRGLRFLDYFRVPPGTPLTHCG
jgi:hypothetical protein